MHSDELELRVLERTRELLIKNKELAALYTVVSSVSSTESLKNVLIDVLRVIVDFFEAEVSSIIVYKDDGNEISHTIWRRDYPETQKILYTENINDYSRRAVISGTPLVIDRFTGDDPQGIQLCEIQSLVSVPITNKGFMLGTITLSSTSAERFNTQDVTLLEVICNQLGVVINNVSLFNVINEERHTLVAVMNSINEGLILFDSKAKIVYANPVFIKAFGLDESDWQDMSFQDMQNYQGYLAVKMPFAEMWDDFTQRLVYPSHEASVTSEDKVDYYLIIGFPVISNDNLIGYGFLARNITREKEIDSLKNSILSTVSHELRTPLTTIRGSAESLLRKDVQWSDDEKDEFVKAIVGEGIRLRELIDNIMDMSKIEAGALNLDKQPANIHKLIERVINRFRMRFHNVHFSVAFDPDVAVVLIDERRIEQVLSNLIENGVKYSPKKPAIQVQTKYLPELNMVRVSVIDNGVGIDVRYQEAVFGRFYRVNTAQTKKISGSGVGLSIAKGIVEAHGGKMSLRSELNKGSQFDFTLFCE
jgi:K+-sensing histidine kinase KdpD